MNKVKGFKMLEVLFAEVEFKQRLDLTSPDYMLLKDVGDFYLHLVEHLCNI